MINVLIIEDEESAFKNLKRILFEINQPINIISWLQSVEQSIDWFKSNALPDLIFLDIHLSDDLSFKIFEYIEVSCPIVFTTAYNEFAIKAFELNSIDYLLKPITQKTVEKAVNKYHLNVKTNSKPYDRLIEDLKSISNTKNYKKRFLVNKGDELKIILTSEIAYFYKSNFTYIVLENGDRYPVKFTLEELVGLLNPTSFYRINRQMITSIKAISKISFWFKGKLKIHLIPEHEETIFISREKSTDFKNWMDK